METILSSIVISIFLGHLASCCPSNPSSRPTKQVAIHDDTTVTTTFTDSTTTGPETTTAAVMMLCYDFGKDGGSHFGECVNVNTGCEGHQKMIAEGLNDSCGDFRPEAFVRCVSLLDQDRVCRPVEAGCGLNEIQQPGSTVLVKTDTVGLKMTIDNLEDCEQMTPKKRCVSAIEYDEEEPACLEDYEICPLEKPSQVPSNQLFTNDNECQSYRPVSYIRCSNVEEEIEDRAAIISDGSDKCIEYDAVTQPDCTEDGYTRQPAGEIFREIKNCNEFERSGYYQICYSKEGIFCSQSCGPSRVVKYVNGTLTYCNEYTVTWKRYVNVGVNRYCRPISDNEEFIINQRSMPAVIPPGNVFDSDQECLDATYYVPCYVPERNEFDCMDDVTNCQFEASYESMEESVSEDNSIYFTSWTDCLSYSPSTYKRCLNLFSGVVICRPNSTQCREDETLTSISDSSDVSECSVNGYVFFSCYDASNPNRLQCAKDIDGCPGSTIPLGETSEGPIRIFGAEVNCLEYSPQWVKCDGNESILCRPVGGARNDDNCENGENSVGSYFNIYDDCVNYNFVER